MNFPPVIALKGKAGSGKSTAASFLVETYGYTLIKFAGPLKRMLSAIGLSQAEIEGGLKESPCDLLCGATPRHAMITLGTEWGRMQIHRDFWVALWRSDVAKVIVAGGRVVVDDCRFENEAVSVRSLGGYIIEIVRPEIGDGSAHISENGDFTPNARVYNTSDKSALLSEIETAIHARMEAAE